MNHFVSSWEAKEFLIGRIAAEAQREGVPLTEVERKMLYFSEETMEPSEAMELNDRFERECNDGAEYEKRIAMLAWNAMKRARVERLDDLKAWSEAILRLNREDHYLTVMLPAVRPHHDLLKLLLAAILIVGVMVAVAYLWAR